MKYLEQDEINAIAGTFLAARKKVKQVKSLKEKQDCEQQQNLCLQQLRFLVLNKTRKYKQFSNHADLEQDGFEALILALKTYNPEKGCFSWWADKYISTRISRAANAHSTIRFPLKKAKETRPYKTSTIPTIVDLAPSAQESLENSERVNKVTQALAQLPEMHQKVVSMVYGFNGIKQHSMGTLIKELAISKPQCTKILREAKDQLKEILQPSII
jgi:RNA polymerase sigma factor (sigma-70 family)